MTHCVINAKNKSEMNNGDIKIYHWKNCPHCHDTLKKMENKCRSLGKNSPVKITSCEVEDNAWCREEWQNARPSNIPEADYGVPVILNLSKEPIIGSQPEIIDKAFNNLINMINKNDAERQQPQQQAQQQAAAPQARQQIKMKSDHGYNQLQNPLCLPPNCNKQTFKNRLNSFLLSNKTMRKNLI